MLKKLIMIAVSALPFVSWADDMSSSKVIEETTMKTIELDTQVGTLAANLYLPKGLENPPVVIVTGAWTTVKEQMPAVYAEALVEQGYAAVTFDFRGWGRSADNVQFLESPARKTEDIMAVVDAVAQLQEVDGERIAGLGVCASSGYMLDAALENKKLQSVAVVAPWLHNKQIATEIYGGEAAVNNLLDLAAKAKNSQDPVYIEAASLSNENSLMYQAPYYTESDRGLIPEYDNRFNVASWDGWLNYDALVNAPQQDKPILMIASEAMALPVGVHQYLDNAGSNVNAVWFEGISQFDFYDQPQAVSKAVAAIVQHLKSTL